MSYKRILVAIDGSPLSAHAANDAAELAQALGAELAFVYVVDISGEVSTVGGLPADDLVALGKQAAEQTLLAAAGRAKVEPPPWRFLKVGKPAPEIIAAAKEWRADLIVIASHGRSGLGRLVLGSVAQAVVHEAHCPVLIIKIA